MSDDAIPTDSAASDAPYWRCASGPKLDEARAQTLQDAYAVAWLLALGQDVDEIVAQLHSSRATVYRLIKVAQENQLLDMRPRVTIPRGTGARILLDQVRVTPVADALREAYRRRGEEELAPLEVIVASDDGLPREDRRDGKKDDRREEWEEKLEDRTEHAQVNRVSWLGARHLMMGILEHGVRTFGISWGYHCRRLSLSLPGGIAGQIPRSEATGINVFPFVGTLATAPDLAQEMIEVSANSNALRCVENLSMFGVEPSQGDSTLPAVPMPLQLTQPCAIPGEIAQDEALLQAVWRYVSRDQSIRAVFGTEWACRHVGCADLAMPLSANDKEPLLQQADTLITGLGPLPESRAVRSGAIERETSQQAQAAGAVADVSGHFICHANRAAACAAALSMINRRVVAPTLDDYIACTRRARMTRRGLGTVLMVSGSRKAEAVEAMISHGAVNVLVCSEDLALKLIGMLR